MSGKRPSFGVNASDSKSEKEASQTNEKVADKSKSKREFGTHVQKEEPEKGVNAEIVKELFSLQRRDFWLKAYALSFLFYLARWGNLTTGIIGLIDLVLFPFVLILLAEGSLMVSNFSTLADWINPKMNQLKQGTTNIGAILWYGSKLILFAFIWKFGFILGLVGLALMLRDLKRMKG